MTTAYRIAAHAAPRDLTTIDADSAFGTAIRELFREIRPMTVVETGAYFGNGTTRVIGESLNALGMADAARFYSIEVNPKHAARAMQNIERLNLPCRLLTGLSVPRSALPTIEQIESAYVRGVEAEGLWVDHEEHDRASGYHRETDFPDAEDDLLGKVVRDEFDGRPDFVLLDSGGHMGHVEFRYLLSLLRGPCWLALDDIRHVKHHRSFAELSRDPRFAVRMAIDEKFGACIARFDPGAARR